MIVVVLPRFSMLSKYLIVLQVQDSQIFIAHKIIARNTNEPALGPENGTAAIHPR